MRKIAVALPYAVSIRDFVHSGALAELLTDSRNKVIIYTLNPEVPELEHVKELGVEVLPFRAHSDGIAERVLKRLYPLFFADQFTRVSIQLEGSPVRRAIAGCFSAVRRTLGVTLMLKCVSVALRGIYKLKRIPRQLDPDLQLLIGTRSLINSLDYGLMAEASLHDIPLCTIAGSWDNFTTKGYFPFPARLTVVWNEKMRRELIELFGVRSDEIEVAGYPRAEMLRSRVSSELTPEDYLRSLGIVGYRRFVLYSASYGELTRVEGHPMPLEYVAIRQISEQLEKTLPDDVCILIRFHPYSQQVDRDYFKDLPRCHVFVPGRQDQYVERVMNVDDEDHLALQIAKSECVISMASTMSIDALCLAKPILNVDFDPVDGLSPKSSIRRFYGYNHFSDLLRITQLPLARSLDQVLKFTQSCLDRTYVSPVDFDAFYRFYVPEFSDCYSKNIRNAVDKVINNG